MKKSLFLIPMALLILTGCSDESSDVMDTQETDVQEAVAIDVHKQENFTDELTTEEKSPTTDFFSYSESEKNLDSQVTAPKTWLY